MTSKSLAAFAFVCLAPVAAFAQTAPATAPVAKAPPAVTAPVAVPATVTTAAKPVAPAAAVPVTAASPTAAIPAEGPGSKRWQTCAADIQKFCGTVEKGKGAVRTCLEGHAAELTPACKTSMAEHAAAHAAKAGEKAADKADKTVKQ